MELVLNEIGKFLEAGRKVLEFKSSNPSKRNVFIVALTTIKARYLKMDGGSLMNGIVIF